jgi:hypothetical protein
MTMNELRGSENKWSNLYKSVSQVYLNLLLIISECRIRCKDQWNDNCILHHRGWIVQESERGW